MLTYEYSIIIPIGIGKFIYIEIRTEGELMGGIYIHV